MIAYYLSFAFYALELDRFIAFTPEKNVVDGHSNV